MSQGMSAGTMLRALVAADLPGLMAVQLACYGSGYAESTEVFARRLASPGQCSVVMEQAGEVVAYLAAYRSRLGKVTPLHGDFDTVDVPDTLYLHDMAVLPRCACQGLANAMLQQLWALACAERLHHSALVSIQGSQSYWARHGYAAQILADETQRQRLAGYGADAVYMVRGLALT